MKVLDPENFLGHVSNRRDLQPADGCDRVRDQRVTMKTCDFDPVPDLTPPWFLSYGLAFYAYLLHYVLYLVIVVLAFRFPHQSKGERSAGMTMRRR